MKPSTSDKFLLGAVFASLAFASSAEIDFPPERNLVGEGEYYLLSDFGDWASHCIRDENAEDVCEASIAIRDLDAGIELDFAITPYAIPLHSSSADVDITPRAFISFLPFSSSPHYEEYSAAITHIDGEVFDGYWCKVTDPEDCFRGPELNHSDLAKLLNGDVATITIFGENDTPEEYSVTTTIEVSLANSRESVERANEFTASVFGIDLSEASIYKEMCDYTLGGDQRRISYAFDEDFHSKNRSRREWMLGSPGNGSCPSYVILAHLAPETTEAQRELFCLIRDPEGEELIGFQQGQKDARGVCTAPSRSFCERVNESKEAALSTIGLVGGIVGGTAATTTATGVTVVAHSSGAAILTGSGGYIAATLGPIASTVAILTAPATLAAASVSVVAVGGAVYVCQSSE